MKRVLVVDDREENAYYLRALLEGHGFTVDTAGNGSEALEVARATPPGLVISDLLMPGMDGYTLLRRWREDPVLRPVPFIVYTATYTQEDDARLAFEMGADEFILKPSEPEELMHRIRGVLDRPARAPAGPGDAEGGGSFEAYSQVLVRKLEEKMLQLEAINQALERDIQERRRAEERLEQSATLLRMAGHVARLGGWELSLPEERLTWSDETCRIHGVPLGSTPTLGEALDFCVPGDRAELAQRFEACIQEGRSFDLEYRITTVAGATSWLRGIGEAVRDSSGTVVRLQGAVQDVSERRALEQKLLRGRRMENIAALTGGMAHDLGNVLSPILLSVQLLKGGEVDDDTLQTLETMESCAHRGAEMVRQVLSFARGMDGHRVQVDLSRIVDDVVRVLADALPTTVLVRKALPEDLWGVLGDPTQLHQVFMNLFLNARDAMTGGGVLSVTAENVEVDDHYAAMGGMNLVGPHVRVSVADTGAGIPPGTVEQIFDPLFTTKPEGEGTGLGLSTVAAILQNHRGSIQVYSEPGLGSTFRIHLPAASEEVREEPTGATPEAWQGNGELVLVVDDEAAVRSITQQTLEAFGYQVATAPDGPTAVAVFGMRRSEIGVVLTDVNMPVMDGPATIRALRRIDPSVRVIVASGVASDGAAARAMEAGAGHLLSKPYTAASLLGVVRRALDEPGPPGGRSP